MSTVIAILCFSASVTKHFSHWSVLKQRARGSKTQSLGSSLVTQPQSLTPSNGQPLYPIFFSAFSKKAYLLDNIPEQKFNIKVFAQLNKGFSIADMYLSFGLDTFVLIELS